MPKSRQLTVVGLLALTVGLTGLIGRSEATPPAGVVGTPLVRATFTDDVGVTFKLRYADGLRTFHPRAEDASEVASNGFVFQPGGSTGWHYHDGRVFGVVREGTLTRTMGDCSVVASPQGSAVTEESGPNAAHNGRNLGPGPVKLWVDYIQPAGTPLAVEVPDPGCG